MSRTTTCPDCGEEIDEEELARKGKCPGCGFQGVPFDG